MIFSTDALAGRHIVVTGASSGLGQDAAIYLSRLGARIALVGRNSERLDAVAADLQGSGHRSLIADIGDDESADSMIKRIVDDGGPLDGLFHSAGVSIVSQVRLTKRRQIDEMFGSAVFGALGIARAISRKGAMIDGGSAVFMSSVSSLRGRRGMVAYSAAKAAASGMVRALAIELAERGIRVNSIAAGAIETEMHQTFAQSVSGEMLDAYRALHPLGFGKPADVSTAVAFLLSDASRWITGIDLSLDGGYAAK